MKLEMNSRKVEKLMNTWRYSQITGSKKGSKEFRNTFR
jgi:hypothetical protein